MPDTPEELLARLAESPAHRYPEDILREMISRREEMTPALLAVLEDARNRPDFYLEGGNWKPLVFSGYLLAQFRETRAYRPLCATLSLPAETASELWGDTIAEGMGQILASVHDGDDAPLRELAANPRVYEYVRGASVPSAFLCLLQAGKMEREALEACAEEMLATGLEREPGFAWDGWTGLCADLGFARLAPLLEQAIEEELCDPFYYGFEDLIANAESGRPSPLRENCHLIDDTIDETSWWHVWTKPKPQKPKPRLIPGTGPKTARKAAPKIGRNDPCPCGSGKKSKRCCGKTGS